MRIRNFIKLFATVMATFLVSCGASDPVDITGNIVGVVYDAERNEPLQGVSMALTPLGKTTTTSQNGSYSFKDIDAGTYRVQAQKTGYKEDSKSVDVSIGDNASLDFHLTPSVAGLQVSQGTLDFGNDDTTLTLDLKNTGSATLNWQISEDIPWLQCIPTSGTISPNGTSSVIVNVDRTGLSRGNYSQTIAFSSNAGSVIVRVNMGVQGLGAKISPEELDFGATTTSLQLTLSNTGSQSLNYVLSASNEWIILSKKSGILTQSDIIIVSVSRAGYAVGDYSGKIDLSISDYTAEIPVRMNVPSKENPTVTLNSVSGVSYNSAIFKGGIVSVGSSKVSRYGFCWDTKELPTITESQFCNLGDCSTAKDFEYAVTQLNAGTKYYVRAYAENGEGISYSNKTKFETLEQPSVPVTETGAISNIQSTQAIVAGNILKIGNDTGITQYGHVWGSTANPTTADHKTMLGSTMTVGSFSSTLTGLSPNQTYHVRAYATNSLGTAYGDDVTFTTVYDIVNLTTIGATDITHSEATTGGSISDKGGHTIKEQGVCWSTSSNPVISDNRQVSADRNDRFTVRISGLREQTSYHARAYAITETNEIYYGNDVSFQTTHEIKLPQVTATAVSSITTNSATFRSSITSDGDGNISDCGFVYSRTPSPTITNATKLSCGKQQSGAFTKQVTGLNDNTTYYVRSYIVNEAGVGYGEEINFATQEIVLPTVSGVTIGRVTYKSVTLSAKVESAGNGTVSEVGFVYSTSPNPVMTNHKIKCATSTSFTGTTSALIPETTYYVRAYAINEKGATLGKEASFTTSKEPDGNDVTIGGYGDDKDWDK